MTLQLAARRTRPRRSDRRRDRQGHAARPRRRRRAHLRRPHQRAAAVSRDRRAVARGNARRVRARRPRVRGETSGAPAAAVGRRGARSRSTATTTCLARHDGASAARPAGARTSTTTSPRATSTATSSCAPVTRWAFDGDGNAYKRNEFGRVDPKGTVATLVDRSSPATTRRSSNGADAAHRFGTVPGSHARRLPARQPPPARPALLVRARRRRATGAGRGCRSSPSCAPISATPAPARSPRSSTSSAAAWPRARPRPAGSRPPISRCISCARRDRDRSSRRARDVLRAGRTTVVIEVALVDEHERDIGIATMSFAVLPRRDTNPEIASIRQTARRRWRRPSRGSRGRCSTSCGVEVRDAARGEIDVPVIEWSLNSMGAMQGGVVATVAEVAAETALRAATNEPLVVTDLYVTYLGFGKVGPVRSDRRRARPRPTGTAPRASSSSTPAPRTGR